MSQHPATEGILRYFDYEHLQEGPLRDASVACHVLAHAMADVLEGPELTAGLRHLLEAKDCFVRAALSTPENLSKTIGNEIRRQYQEQRDNPTGDPEVIVANQFA